MSESRKLIVRVFCSYARLFSTLLLGVAVVPLTIAWLGDDAFGLVALLGANIGLAAIFWQIAQRSLVRELGAAYHAGDGALARAYPAICRLSLYGALLSLGSFGLVVALLPVFNIPEHFERAAFWFVVGQGLQTAGLVLLSPVLNMFVVAERFVGHSVWFVGSRATNIVSVLILGYVLHIEDHAAGLLWLGILWPALSMLSNLVAAWWMVRVDPRLRPTFKRPEPGAVRQVMGTFAWNSGVQVAMNLHELFPPLLLNLLLGTVANAAWGIGFRLVAYIRMVTTGMQFGSDAVSARLSAGEDPEVARKRLQRLTDVQTRLTALVSLPAAAGVLVYAYPIMHLWVGRQLHDYEQVMAMALNIARILAVAIAARAVSDTWALVLYGAGHVRAYAPLVITGGVIAPMIAVALVFLLPEDIRYFGPPISFTFAFVGLHLIGIPIVAARCLGLHPSHLILSAGRSLVATLVAVGAGLGVLAAGGEIHSLAFGAKPTLELGNAIAPVTMLLSIGAFSLTYAVLAFALVLNREERARALRPVRRFLPVSAP